MRVNNYHEARSIVGEECGGFQLTEAEGKGNDKWFFVPTMIYDDYPEPPLNDLSPNWFVNRETGETYRAGSPFIPLVISPQGNVYAADLLDSMTQVFDR